MGTVKLGAPPASLHTGPLDVIRIDSTKLFRISTHNTGEPFFNDSGNNRFDAPGCSMVPRAPEFRTCYFGMTLSVAIAETVLHDAVPVNGAFPLASTELEAFYVIRFSGDRLTLANLTGPSLKKLSGSADLASADIYGITQQWALAVFQHPSKVDGFVYMSRHLNTARAVVLFDRARAKLRMVPGPKKLVAALGFAAAARKFNLVAV